MVADLIYCVFFLCPNICLCGDRLKKHGNSATREILCCIQRSSILEIHFTFQSATLFAFCYLFVKQLSTSVWSLFRPQSLLTNITHLMHNVCEQRFRNRSQIDSYRYLLQCTTVCVYGFSFSLGKWTQFDLCFVDGFMGQRPQRKLTLPNDEKTLQNESVKIVYELFAKPFFAHRKRKQLLLSCYYRYRNITFDLLRW